MIEIVPGHINISALPSYIKDFLPNQGCIEVQRDAPGKEHKLHEHTIDETLVIIDGAIKFYWEGGEKICQEGDLIRLPAGTPHGSIALSSGASYLIVFNH